MYLIVPVPNPEKKTLAVKYASHQNSYFSKLAVQVSKKSTAYIAEIVDAAKELLEVRANLSFGPFRSSFRPFRLIFGLLITV